MTGQWVVLLRTGAAAKVPYGPFDDEGLAVHFAGFLTKEVDPAQVVPLRSPVAELIGFWRSQRAENKESRPAEWPPQPGQVWEDRDRNRWFCTASVAGPYLVCVARRADDSAEEIWRRHGPLTFVQFVTPNGEEPPF